MTESVHVTIFGNRTFSSLNILALAIHIIQGFSWIKCSPVLGLSDIPDFKIFGVVNFPVLKDS